jgi:hypothetical protein
MSFPKAKQLAHEWATRRKNQQWIASLENHLKTADPILVVHQMGRAGSMTTVNTLRDAGVSVPVYHTHWLNPVSIAERLAWLKGVPEKRQPLNLRVARRIADELQKGGTTRRSWKLVSIFREPVGRNVSTFFLAIDRFFDDFFRRYESGEIGIDQVRDTFLKTFGQGRVLEWLDKEIGDVFGIDVYERDFPHDAGYQIFRKGNVDLLLIKLERLNDCFQAAFEDFLDTRIPNLVLTHITEKDPSYSMYKEFLRQVVMPPDYLEQMYSSRFARHFYRPEEIQGLMEKWSGR